MHVLIKRLERRRGPEPKKKKPTESTNLENMCIDNSNKKYCYDKNVKAT